MTCGLSCEKYPVGDPAVRKAELATSPAMACPANMSVTGEITAVSSQGAVIERLRDCWDDTVSRI
jgi:hypothetical protein